MNERIQRTGNRRHVDVGGAQDILQEEWKVLSSDLRLELERFWTFLDAEKYLIEQIKMERIACPTGGCDD
jgi:hypothetical protein